MGWFRLTPERCVRGPRAVPGFAEGCDGKPQACPSSGMQAKASFMKRDMQTEPVVRAGHGKHVDFHCMIQAAIQAALKSGGSRAAVAAVVAAAINTVAQIIGSEKHEAAGRQHAVLRKADPKGGDKGKALMALRPRSRNLHMSRG